MDVFFFKVRKRAAMQGGIASVRALQKCVRVIYNYYIYSWEYYNNMVQILLEYILKLWLAYSSTIKWQLRKLIAHIDIFLF